MLFRFKKHIKTNSYILQRLKNVTGAVYHINFNMHICIRRFFAHVQTGPEAHPASCTMGTGSFPGVKRPEHGADHPLPSSAEVKKE
jgi:hypothetical protein